MALPQLQKKLKQKRARIAVLGMGYVGLPLAVAFARKGYRVTGLDVDPRKVRSLKAGRSYILDVPSAEIKGLLRQKRLSVTDDYRALAATDVMIICVPTPLSKTREPDVSYVIEAATRIAQHLRKGQLVVLESTTYPGTTEEVVLPILQKSGLRPEKDFFLAFSPERVDPGNKEFKTTTIPKVVGGMGPASTKAARLLYESVIESLVEVSSSKTAEMVKLLENTFRSVNIGLINEMAVLCHYLGVDIWEVIGAAKTKPFGFMPFYPGPGLGGHCLPVDPLYLSWKSRHHGFEAKMIEAADVVNERMPLYVVERITHLLNKKKIPLKKASVLLLGVAYKRNIDDTRESPALDVLNYLLEEEAEVCYSDPFVKSFHTGRVLLKSRRLTPAVLKKQQCVVILTDHGRFDYEMIVKHSKAILDTRNVLRRFQRNENIHFL